MQALAYQLITITGAGLLAGSADRHGGAQEGEEVQLHQDYGNVRQDETRHFFLRRSDLSLRTMRRKYPF